MDVAGSAEESDLTSKQRSSQLSSQTGRYTTGVKRLELIACQPARLTCRKSFGLLLREYQIRSFKRDIPQRSEHQSKHCLGTKTNRCFSYLVRRASRICAAGFYQAHSAGAAAHVTIGLQV